MNQSFPGVKDLVAMVGVTEKGFATFTMTAEGAVGHSSMATEETAIVTLAKGISKYAFNNFLMPILLPERYSPLNII